MTMPRVPECDPRSTARDRVRASDGPAPEMPNVADFSAGRHSWSNTQTCQLLPQRSDGSRHARLNRANGQIECLCNLCIGSLLDENESGNHLQLRWQLPKSARDGFGQSKVGTCRRLNVVTGRNPACPRAHRPQMVASRVRGDAPHPSSETPRRIKAGSCAIRPPECFDENIFGGARIPDNPQDPLKNLDLELPEERFERVLIALYEPPEEFAVQFVRHRLLPCLTCPLVQRFQLISAIKSSPLQISSTNLVMRRLVSNLGISKGMRVPVTRAEAPSCYPSRRFEFGENSCPSAVVDF